MYFLNIFHFVYYNINIYNYIIYRILRTGVSLSRYESCISTFEIVQKFLRNYKLFQKINKTCSNLLVEKNALNQLYVIGRIGKTEAFCLPVSESW